MPMSIDYAIANINHDQEQENKMQAHTPTPWMIRPDYSSEYKYHLWNEDGNFPDDTSPEAMDANAGFIMRAVNSHDAMLKALISALPIIANNRPDGSICADMIAAIKLAKGE